MFVDDFSDAGSCNESIDPLRALSSGTGKALRLKQERGLNTISRARTKHVRIKIAVHSRAAGGRSGQFGLAHERGNP